MRDPPDLRHETLAAALGAGYGIDVGSLEFLPIGNDSRSWVYAVHAAAGAAYFLKVRTNMDNEASLVLPRDLRDRGAPHVVAPLWTTAGTLWTGMTRSLPRRSAT